MRDEAVSFAGVGLVTSVGYTTAATCAAIRAKLSNPTATRFIGAEGDIVAHQVLLDYPWQGVPKLARLALLAVTECLTALPRRRFASLPVILCVAEAERPGRPRGLEAGVLAHMQQELQVGLSVEPHIIRKGRGGVALALSRARKLVYERGCEYVLIVAVDSLLNQETITYYESCHRLLSDENSDGFMVGEGASALLVSRSVGDGICAWQGMGMAQERAHIDSELPLRADGLSEAIRRALADAGATLHEIHFRVSDLSGEQYYFKEADLAISRVLRVRKQEFDLWHPAECVGAAGAALGGICLGVAHMAMRERYAPGQGVLVHFADDAGDRAALVGLGE